MRVSSAPDHGDLPTTRSSDGTPVATTFAQPARPVGAGRRRGRLLAVGWAGVLATVVLIGVGGRPDGGVDGPHGVPASAPPTVLAGRTPAARPSPAPIVLEDPAPPPATVSGIPVWVRGDASPAVTEVLVRLVDGGTVIAAQTVRPSRTGGFSAVFTVRPPRPPMDATVLAVGLDAGSVPVGTASRPVRLAPLDADPAADAGARPRRGEDGVLGSRGVDVAALTARDTPAQAPSASGSALRIAGPSAPARPVQR